MTCGQSTKITHRPACGATETRGRLEYEYVLNETL